jgi:hypothetical protein
VKGISFRRFDFMFRMLPRSRVCIGSSGISAALATYLREQNAIGVLQRDFVIPG